MTTLEIKGLAATVDGTEILKGVDLTISSGEVHAVMGPNGSGKSTLSYAIMGRPGYEVTGGSVLLDGVDMLALLPYQRAQAGLFLAMQYPTEVPGVALRSVLEAAADAGGRDPSLVAAAMSVEAEAIGFGEAFLDRPLNVDLSGGEQKRNETLQLCVMEPKIAILDELDSGLDVDALRMVSRRIQVETKERGLAVLAITHYQRLFEELHPDFVHVFADGKIQATGGPELAVEIEKNGYTAWADDRTETSVSFGLGLGEDPFA